jgi:hypothetical protein
VHRLPFRGFQDRLLQCISYLKYTILANIKIKSPSKECNGKSKDFAKVLFALYTDFTNGRRPVEAGHDNEKAGTKAGMIIIFVILTKVRT